MMKLTMMKLSLFISSVLLMSDIYGFSFDFSSSSVKMFNETLDIHMGVFKPKGKTRGDVLYFHGLGDRFENHLPLFDQWTKRGLRVIAFDFPSHGKTRNLSFYSDLNWTSFVDLGEIARRVEKESLEDSGRPLFLAGWSAGGLLAIRMIQSPLFSKFSRDINGLILFAPGVSVEKCVGNKLCVITNETLTHNRSLYNREVSPSFPFKRPVFSSKLLWNANKSWKEVLPSNLPVLTFVAGEKQDKYVKTKKLVKWLKVKRSEGAAIKAVHCSKARHELDNEPARFGGKVVRSLSALYFDTLLRGVMMNFSELSSSPCKLIMN